MPQLLKLKEIEDFFQSLTTRILGFDNTKPENQGKVRIDWQPVGAPAWKRDEDIVFIQINNPDDPITYQREASYQQIDSINLDKQITFTRVHSVKWICYGPNSYDRAEAIKNGLFRESFKQECTLKNVFIIPEIVPPFRVNEEYNAQWWQRTDLTVHFNEYAIVDDTVPFLLDANVTTIR